MNISKSIKCFFWLVFGLIILACGKEEITDAQYFERAKTYYAQGDVRASIIELKNTLQKNASHIDARFLLGKLYLSELDGVSAEKELRRAKSLGKKEQELDLFIVQSMKLQSKYREITDLYPLDVEDIDSSNTKLASLIGEAYLMSADLNRGEKIINQAYALNPDDPSIILSVVKLKIEKSEVNAAEKLLDNLLSVSSEFDEAWLIRANVYFLKGKYAEAQSAYQKVIELAQEKRMNLSVFSAYIGMIRSQLTLKDLEVAEQSIIKLETLAPKHPMPIYYHGLLAYELKKYALATEKLQIVVRELPDYLPSYLLLGTIRFIEGDYEQADIYLTKYVNNVPSHIHARKVLAATRMRQRRPNEAVEILEPVSDKEDAALLAMIGQASIASGDFGAADQYMRRALKVGSPQSSVIRAELARVYLTQGNYDQAIVELNELVKSHPKKAKLMLATAFIEQKKYAQALRVANELNEAFPEDPVVYFLLAQTNASNNKKGEARKYYYRAIDSKKDFVPAYLALAKLEMDEGDLTKAAVNFDNVLLYDSKNDQAMLGLAQLAERNGDVDKALEWVKKASKEARDGLLARILLTRYYVSTDNFGQASMLAEETVKQYDADYRSLQLLAFVQLQKRQMNQAVVTLQQVVNKRPKDPAAYIRLASVQAAIKDYTSAFDNINKALAIDSENFNALVALAKIESIRGNLNNTIKIGSKLEKDNQKLSIGLVIQGDAYTQLNDYKTAVLKFEQAYKKQPSAAIALSYSKALFASGNQKGSLKPLEDWLGKNPGNSKMQLILGTAYQSVGLMDEAITMLEGLLQSEPENAFVLNNLSWAYYEANDARALQYAEKAHRLRPEIAAITDTLGWLLVQEGSVKKGAKILEKAVEQSKGEVPEIQYHYAAALHKLGQVNKARDLLQEVLGSEVQFSAKENARVLLDKIKSH